ncbi:MAG: carboxylesterase/lipase family protein [Candidatus Binatia bacterium]
MTQLAAAILLAGCPFGEDTGTAASAAGAATLSQSSVALCHRLPGDPDDVEIITVDEEDVPAHRAHGDELATDVIQTPAGPIRGCIDEEGVARFLGVPYAAPPVGGLRWQPPEPAAPFTEVFEATALGPHCIQFDPFAEAAGREAPILGEEDCLQLNVYAPAGAWESPGSLPVMVWIHGGGNVRGSAVDRFGAEQLRYDGHAYAKIGVVLVTINFRLGPFGFLALDALGTPTGNHGLKDQAAALRWVRDNVVALGGDPENVTIFGQSAGGQDACIHLVLPESRGLFRRAIDQSGPCAATALEPRIAQSRRLAEAAGCCSAGCPEDETNPDPVLECLRQAPAETIVSALPPSAGAFSATAVAWGPTIDGVDLTANPIASFIQGNFDREADVLLGTTDTEGTLFPPLGAIEGAPGMVEEAACATVTCGAPDHPGIRCDYTDLVCGFVGTFSTPEQATRVRDAYCLSESECAGTRRGEELVPPFLPYFGSTLCEPEAFVEGECLTPADYAAGEVVTDVFTCVTRFAARALAIRQAPGASTFLYHFEPDPPPPGALPPDLDLGATHSMELTFLFQSPNLTPWPPVAPHAQEQEALSNLMIDSWVAFASSGQPDDPLVWPRFLPVAPESYRIFDLEPRQGQQLKFGRCNFWDPVFLKLPVP